VATSSWCCARICSDSAHAETVAERIVTVMTAPFALADHRIGVSSVGIAFSGPGQDIPEALLRDADLAMYQAKNSGGGLHQVLDPVARLAAEHCGPDYLLQPARGPGGHHGQATSTCSGLVIETRTPPARSRRTSSAPAG
jgi:hypothetical protein